MVVQFLPTAEGMASDSLVVDLVTSSNGSPTDTGQVVIVLLGEGTVQSGGNVDIDLSGEDILFNGGDSVDVGVTVEEDITVTNSGDVPVTITVTEPNDPFDVSGGTRTWTITPSDSVVLTVSYTPMSEGNHTGTVVITWVDGEDVITRNILLQGYATADLSSVSDRAEAGGAFLDLPSPNPVSDRSTITYSVEQGSDVSLVLYNTLGEMVQVLARTTVPAGTHTVRFETDDLQSGVYTLVLRTDRQVLSRPLTIQR